MTVNPDGHAFLYDAVQAETGIDPFARVKAGQPSKRDKGRAWRLTNRVWSALSGAESTTIAGVEVRPVVRHDG